MRCNECRRMIFNSIMEINDKINTRVGRVVSHHCQPGMVFRRENEIIAIILANKWLMCIKNSGRGL